MIALRRDEEAEEEDIELFEAGEDAAVAFHGAEEPFDLIAFLVKGAVVAPGIDARSPPATRPPSSPDPSKTAASSTVRSGTLVSAPSSISPSAPIHP
jgi:hypothetical protein